MWWWCSVLCGVRFWVGDVGGGEVCLVVFCLVGLGCGLEEGGGAGGSVVCLEVFCFEKCSDVHYSMKGEARRIE
jgi:hypothetical protein